LLPYFAFRSYSPALRPSPKPNLELRQIYSGGKTANGEIAKASGMTAAHKTLPFGTLVRVTHQHTGRSIVVRINDRGPFVRGRVIDVMPAAARALGFSGLAPVTLDVIDHQARSAARS
jgi:rare lipoprotein A